MENVDLGVIYVCVFITPSSPMTVECELSGGRREGIYTERFRSGIGIGIVIRFV